MKKANYIFSFIGFIGIILTIGSVAFFNKTNSDHEDCEKQRKINDSLYKLEIKRFQYNEDTLANNYFIVNKKDLKLQNYDNRKRIFRSKKDCSNLRK